MGFDDLVILMVDWTDVKVGLQCLKNGLDPSHGVVILPNWLLDGHRAVAPDLIAVRRASTVYRDVVVAVLAEPFEVSLNGDVGVHDDNLLLSLGGWRVQRPHHVLHRGAIGRVAGKDHRAHEESVLVGHRPKNYDGSVRALLLAVSELAVLRQTGRLHVSIGEVEEVHRVVKAELVANTPVKVVLHTVVEGIEVEGALVEPVLGDALRVDAKELAQGGVLAEVTERPMLRTRVDGPRGNLDQGKVDMLFVPSLGAEKHTQLQAPQGLKADGLRPDLTGHDVLQAVAYQDRRSRL